MAAAGALRNESASLLAGSGLTASFLLSVAGVIVERRRLLKARLRMPSAFDPAVTRRTSGDEPSDVLVIDNPSGYGPIMPGVYARVRIRLEARCGRMASASLVLPDPPKSAEATLESGTAHPGRGVYRADSAVVEAADVFGYCTAGLRIEGPFSFLVPPGGAESAFVPALSPGGDRISPTPRLSRSDEFYDSRRYVPGDDPRRLNWKQYGHYGELYLRIGEPVPPPRSLVVVLLDTERPERLPASASASLLDGMVAAARAFADAGKLAGHETVCVMPGFSPNPKAIEAGDYLADAAWDDGTSAVEFPPDPAPRVVSYAAAGSKRSIRLKREFEARGIPFSIVEAGWTLSPRSLASRARNAFLLPAIPDSGRGPPVGATLPAGKAGP